MQALFFRPALSLSAGNLVFPGSTILYTFALTIFLINRGYEFTGQLVPVTTIAKLLINTI